MRGKTDFSKYQMFFPTSSRITMKKGGESTQREDEDDEEIPVKRALYLKNPVTIAPPLRRQRNRLQHN
jgi:hypothetical protein